MTFCLAMKIKEGLVALADTRITSGTEQITGKKVSLHENHGQPFFLMTSGLTFRPGQGHHLFQRALGK